MNVLGMVMIVAVGLGIVIGLVLLVVLFPPPKPLLEPPEKPRARLVLSQHRLLWDDETNTWYLLLVIFNNSTEPMTITSVKVNGLLPSTLAAATRGGGVYYAYGVVVDVKNYPLSNFLSIGMPLNPYQKMTIVVKIPWDENAVIGKANQTVVVEVSNNMGEKVSATYKLVLHKKENLVVLAAELRSIKGEDDTFNILLSLVLRNIGGREITLTEIRVDNVDVTEAVGEHLGPGETLNITTTILSSISDPSWAPGTEHVIYIKYVERGVGEATVTKTVSVSGE